MTKSGFQPGLLWWEAGDYFFLFIFGFRGYWHCGHFLPIVPALGDSEDDCGEADGM
jgi:hypothetical protein